VDKIHKKIMALEVEIEVIRDIAKQLYEEKDKG
jgi:hypothetical protein